MSLETAQTADSAAAGSDHSPKSSKPAASPKGGKARVAEPEPEAQGAHDDFDWESGNKAVSRYGGDVMDKMTAEIDATFQEFNDNEIVSATIMAITDTDVVLNIGFKSDGLISTSEFRDLQQLRVGDVVDVFVVSKEDEKGQLVLSRKSAKLLKAWDGIVDAYKNDTVVTGTVISKTKGGLIVDVFGLETFLPGSQIDVKPIMDYDAFVGKRMEFKVVKINEAIKNAVVSHKALIESDLEAQRQEIIGKLEKGQVLEGTIKNITDFGAFIDLGGVDGLLYITDISWGRISHPKEVLELNQQLNVVVLDFDDAKKRISLGLKQLTPHPWDVLDETIQTGSKVKGRIVNIEDYGAFLEIIPGVEGLIHISEVSWSNQPVNSKEFFKVNEEYEAAIVTIDREERKMSLSLKQLSQDPWLQVSEKYPAGSQHSGLVKNLTPYGVFVELDENIGGMVHISDLSWIKRFQHPSEFVKVGERLPVVVLDIDHEGRKISLGHKQIEEDPWDTFASIFPVGSVHEATVIRKEEKGAIVGLPYGLEGFVPNRHLKKEDNKTSVEVDEVLPFKVIEFDRNDKRIVVSHNRYLKDLERENSPGADVQDADQDAASGADASEDRAASSAPARSKRGAAAAPKANDGEALKKVNRKVEKSTFGELDALSKLKAQLEATEGSAAPAAKTPAAPKAAAAPAQEAPASATEQPAASAEAAAPEAAAEATAEAAAPKAKAKPKAKPKAADADAEGEAPEAAPEAPVDEPEA
ncbi:MAG: 30S ribosomal protein S1 [Bacteroidetes bacterium]|nr:30S ribosomal protein S1 [Bacteroidota bacterium]